jgi:hypothetical protein
MKPTIEEVKEYFKDAEIITDSYNDNFLLSKNGFDSLKLSNYGNYTVNTNGGDHVYLWTPTCGYSKITKRRETETVTVPKQFVLDAHESACSQWKEKIEKQLPDLFPSFSVKIGDRFECDGEDFILARVKPNVINLIRLDDGHNWDNPLKVKDCHNITKEEFKKLCGGFKLNKIS